jgi:hypothetical protein
MDYRIGGFFRQPSVNYPSDCRKELTDTIATMCVPEPNLTNRRITPDKM